MASGEAIPNATMHRSPPSRRRRERNVRRVAYCRMMTARMEQKKRAKNQLPSLGNDTLVPYDPAINKAMIARTRPRLVRIIFAKLEVMVAIATTGRIRIPVRRSRL